MGRPSREAPPAAPRVGERDPVAMERLQRAGRRWLWMAVASVVAFAAVYVVAVLTPFGQTWENAALSGSDQVSDAERAAVGDQLALIQVWSLAVAVTGVCIVGLVRRQVAATVAAVGVIGVGVGLTEVLKHWVLARPDLVAAPADISHNSFPSGHTAIAMTLMVAVFLVVPYRLRGWAMFGVMGWATGIGALTVTAHWHRLSDTLGSDLIALALGSGAALWMLRRGLVEPVEATRVYRGRVVYVVAATAVAALALVLGVFLGVVSATQGLEDDISRFNAYLSAQALASAGSIFAALIYWGSWHRLTLRERRRSTSQLTGVRSRRSPNA